jgi:hypothetical protein
MIEAFCGKTKDIHIEYPQFSGHVLCGAYRLLDPERMSYSWVSKYNPAAEIVKDKNYCRCCREELQRKVKLE